jgi:hypothetical protein
MIPLSQTGHGCAHGASALPRYSISTRLPPVTTLATWQRYCKQSEVRKLELLPRFSPVDVCTGFKTKSPLATVGFHILWTGALICRYLRYLLE